MQRSKRTRLGMGAWALVLLLMGACEDDLNRTCEVDTDCKKVDSCCDGCIGIAVTEILSDCDETCVQSACSSTNMGNHVAVCRANQCELVAPPAP